MKKIKLLVSSRPKLRSEVILNLINSQFDMEVVGEVLDPLQLLNAVRITHVDGIIITPLKANGEPKICSILLQKQPHLKILTISSKSEAAYLYQSDVPKQRIEDPTQQSIVDTI
ncbi:MAG: hypothetical protein KDE57_11415, partial [Calditrichaeota bacterium]|nr:hypothetical protein [Calditrichota bacterium]